MVLASKRLPEWSWLRVLPSLFQRGDQGATEVQELIDAFWFIAFPAFFGTGSWAEVWRGPEL
jgi:hypothetical protein